MTTLAGRTIAALRSEHDTLAALVPALSADQLTGPSGASAWTVADVLSHMGSGAEIQLAGLRATLGQADAPGDGFNQSVWDRWNALSPQDQAAGMLRSDAALIEAFEAIGEERHDELKLKTFLPEPVPLATFVGLRLSETSPHSWDVRAGLDPAAELLSAPLLAEHLTGAIGFLLGFIGKPEGVDAVVEVAETPYRIVIDDSVRFTTESPATTASFDGPLEAALRLLYGRLKPQFTPDGLTVSGNVSLDQLRTAFPGF
jgi:uncharacterized protein (TIGR03083 family)